MALTCVACVSYWSGQAAADSSCFITKWADNNVPLADWIGQAGPREMLVHPDPGAAVAYNPPTLRWPAVEGASGYDVMLNTPVGRSITHETLNNWLFLGGPLAPGQYDWQVRYRADDSAPSSWSTGRRFTVPPDAIRLPAPDFAALLDRAARTPHPRAVPQGETWTALLTSLHEAERRDVFNAFLKQVETSSIRAVSADPDVVDQGDDEDAADDDRINDTRGGSKEAKRMAYAESARAMDAAYAWIATQDDRFRDEAARRAVGLARWGTKGRTGIETNDLASQRIAFSLAVVYDLLYSTLTEEEREALRHSIASRTEDLLDRYVLDASRGLARRPQNSHGFNHVGAIAAIAVLLAGDLPAAEKWYFATLPLYVAVMNPWGGDDGGFANGTNYAVVGLIKSVTYWDVIRNATGFDIAGLPWPRAVGRFLFAFLPPGSPASVFGDGADADHYFPERWARAAAIYAERVRTPLNRLYAARWNQTPPVDPVYLFAPLGPTATEQAAEPCDAAVFPSIGWAAMHSDLLDPHRTSIYFKASPYGSVNHSHADQNSFVIDALGVRLAIDSGYYDSYRSRHRRDWTTQTEAHNAITFDGGQGQKTQSKAASGHIVYFSHTTALDVVVGDATRAYGRALKTARRTLLYLRPDNVLIYDLLESDRPRHWEWNIHSLTPFVEEAPSRLRIDTKPASMCLTLLDGPPVQFIQSSEFPVPPKGRKARPNQWHGRFTTVESSKTAEFLVLLSVGCHGSTVSHARPSNSKGFAVNVDGTRMLINAEGAVAE